MLDTPKSSLVPLPQLVFLQGQFVPEEHAVVSVLDRAFRYGDALFEAALVRHGKMFRWAQHLARLERSAQFLKIALPYSSDELSAFARELIARNELTDGVLRLQLSRGIGPRGYAPTGQEQPLVVMSLHPAPPSVSAPWKLTVSSWRIVANDPLAYHKTCSRLLQVMAASEARERGADECVLMNTGGAVTEGSTSNVFWIKDGTVGTPSLDSGALPGVTRAVVLEICDALGIPRAERVISPEQLPGMDGVFLTLTSRGVVEAVSLDRQMLHRSPLTARLRAEFEALLARECA